MGLPNKYERSSIIKRHYKACPLYSFHTNGNEIICFHPVPSHERGYVGWVGYLGLIGIVEYEYINCDNINMSNQLKN